MSSNQNAFLSSPFSWSKDKAMQMYKEILAAQAAVQQKEHVSEWDVKFRKKRGVEVEEVHGTVFVSIYGSIVWDPLFPTLPYRISKVKIKSVFFGTKNICLRNVDDHVEAQTDMRTVFLIVVLWPKERSRIGLKSPRKKTRLHGTPKSKMRWKLPPKRFGIWDTCLRRKRLKQLDGSFIIYETLDFQMGYPCQLVQICCSPTVSFAAPF